MSIFGTPVDKKKYVDLISHLTITERGEIKFLYGNHCEGEIIVKGNMIDIDLFTTLMKVT